MPVPRPLADRHVLANRLALPHLELSALPSAVPRARHYARAVLWDSGLKELIEPVELVVSEIVTNAVRVSGALNVSGGFGEAADPIVRLWLSVEEQSVFVFVWDASPVLPEQQTPRPDAETGRGLLLVEMFSEAWGSFAIADQPGKVVWALCEG